MRACGEGGIRTYDHHLNGVPLYLLSYIPKNFRCPGWIQTTDFQIQILAF